MWYNKGKENRSREDECRGSCRESSNHKMHLNRKRQSMEGVLGEVTTKKLTAIIEREGDGYVSLCPELEIASQGSTIEEARDNLREALELFFECASPEEVQQRLRGEVYITQVEVAIG